MSYFIYMLRCEDNSIYTGITTDINRRMKEHFSKNEKCAKYTLSHSAKNLESVWKADNKALALKLEYHIKQLSKSQKEELIVKNNLEELLSNKIEFIKYKKIDIKLEEKLNKLFNECINELGTIGIKILDNEELGSIDIKLSKRNNKRYGCCKPELPVKNSKYIIKVKNKKYIHYARYLKHHIEISPWVLELNDEIIKNTIMHEIIHCFPLCDNHGAEFKKYAKIINEKLHYNITAVGNKKEDYNKSNLKFEEKNSYNYKIQCQKCGMIMYRKRLRKDLIKKYRCGKCGGKLKLIDDKNMNAIKNNIRG